MSAREARRRFAAARVARLATIGADGAPHLVPVTFAVLGDRVVTAVDHKPKSTRSLRRLRNVRARPAVCLLADEYRDDWSRLWWVRCDGNAHVEPTPDEPTLAALAAKYPQYRDRPPDGPTIVVAIGRLGGWRATTVEECR